MRIRLRVAYGYEALNTQDPNGDGIIDDPDKKYSVDLGTAGAGNNPLYKFGMDDIAVDQNDSAALDACSLINVVPNPYYVILTMNLTSWTMWLKL